MAKIKIWIDNDDPKKKRLIFICPGCNTNHFIDGTWQFNNDFDKPTITPSILTGYKGFTERRCHSYITDGKIKFLGDCFHELKNQTVDLPDVK